MAFRWAATLSSARGGQAHGDKVSLGHAIDIGGGKNPGDIFSVKKHVKIRLREPYVYSFQMKGIKTEPIKMTRIFRGMPIFR